MLTSPRPHRLNARFPRSRAWLTDSRVLVVVLSLSRLLFLPLRVVLLVGSTKYYDYRHFYEMGRLSARGLYPYLHYWVEYPPLFPWLTALAYQLSVRLGSGLAVEAWFYSITGLLRVGAEIGTFVVMARLAARLWGAGQAWRSLLLYGLLFIPYYLWNGAFDTLPTLLYLLALYFLIWRRPMASALCAGLGFWTKLFPALALPIAFCALSSWRRRLLYAGLFAAAAAALIAPLAVLNPSMTWASAQVMLGRRVWETVWAILDGHYAAGGVTSLAERFAAPVAGPEGALDWTGAIATAAFSAVMGSFYVKLWGERRPAHLVAAGGFGLAALLLCSKGYSPQYLTWLAPLIAVALPNRKGALYLAGLGLANLCDYPLYYSLFPAQHWILVVGVVLRAVLFLALAITFWKMALDSESGSRPLCFGPDRLDAHLKAHPQPHLGLDLADGKAPIPQPGLSLLELDEQVQQPAPRPIEPLAEGQQLSGPIEPHSRCARLRPGHRLSDGSLRRS